MFIGNLTEKCRGIVIYVKNSIPTEKCEHLNSLPLKETSWCEIRLNSTEKLLIGGIYKSPNCDSENHEELFSMLRNEHIKGHKNLILVGDFNFPGIDWNS